MLLDNTVNTRCPNARRRWSAAEKLRIVEESFSAPRLASATARRHGISNQLLFAWRKVYEGRLGDFRRERAGVFIGNVVVLRLGAVDRK